ncbi:uncharacterized protein LOC143276996 isoform X2 [Babylonia areolata]|uniref:uncharacterized protein LOC143276996 isoform X2 n=1 Tax=Babylonia areolata TaxID=304850 RepID=UPI003FCF2ACC
MVTITPDAVRSESTSSRDEDNGPAGDNQKQIKVESSVTNKTKPQLSVSETNRAPLHKSANTSGSLLSQNRSHVCQRCPAAFVHFRGLQQHMTHFHGQSMHVTNLCGTAFSETGD